MLTLFIICTMVNIILSTIKSIVTVKGGKTVAAVINAITFGFYTYVVILTADGNIPTLTKCIITAICNLIGVWIVKYFEEKAKRDKLWLVKCTIPKEKAEMCRQALKIADISFSWIDIEKYVVFDTYCDKQSQTAEVTKIAKMCKGKTFATENKLWGDL